MRPLESIFVGLPWLGAALFQATLGAGLALLLWMVCQRWRPGLRAAILRLGLVGVVVVPVLAALTPVWLPVPDPAAIPSWSAQDAVPARPDILVTEPPHSDISQAQADSAPIFPSSDPAPEATLPTALEPLPLTNTERLPVRPWLLSWWPAALWLVGVLGCLARFVVRLRGLSTSWRRARVITDPICLSSLRELQQVYGLRGDVHLRECQAIRSPLALGWRQPCILLPSVWSDWSAEQVRWILAHELAHIRRRDFLTGLLAELVRCLYWFHPLVLILANKLRLEQEYAVDAWVASTANGNKLPYMCCLARLALELDQPAAALAPSLWRRRPEILRRIDMLRRLTNDGTRNPGRQGAWLLSFLAVTAYIAIAGLGYLHSADPIRAPEKKAEDNKPADPKPKAEAKEQGPVDRHGDPLPPGAFQRLGTIRFRYAGASLAYSPDGKLLAIGGADNQIRLFDAGNGKEIRRLAGHLARTFDPPREAKSAFDALVGSVGQGNVTTVAFAPDGKTLASGGWDETIRLWDVNTGKELRRLEGHASGMVASVHFSPDGKYLASRGGNDGAVFLWDVQTGQIAFKTPKVQRINPWRFNRDTPLAFSPDGKTLFVGDAKAIQLLAVPTGQVIRKLDAHLVCTSLAVAADGKTLATAGVDGPDKHSLRLWDLGANKELRRCALPKDEPPISLAFSPDGGNLAAVVEEDDMHIFDVATGKPLHRLPQYWASRVAYAPDGKTLASVRGATIRLWDPATGKERALEFEGHQSGVTSVALSADGKLAASGGENIRLWDPVSGKPTRTIATAGSSIALSPDGKTLASVGRGRDVHIWDVAGGQEKGPLKGHQHYVKGVAFSPDGKYLASGDAQAVIRIWDVANSKELHVIDMKSGAENLSFAFSPDGKTLACAGAWNDSSFLAKGAAFKIQGIEMTRKEGYFVLLWDTTTGKEVRRFGGLQDKIKSVAFSPDGKKLAAASRDGRICLWDVSSGNELLFIAAHPNHTDASFSPSPCVAFSPDGKKLASASTDRTIRIWDAATAKELGSFQAEGGLYTMAFTADGKALATGGADATVLLWDLTKPIPRPANPKGTTLLIGD
jgi:WD40 repeat protein/beta-lactamase regulating signal transducer with metallopeptidase domain